MTTTIEEKIKLPMIICGGCGYKMDSAIHLRADESIPVPESISICVRCGHVAIYTEDFRLRELTKREMGELKNSDTGSLISQIQFFIDHREQGGINRHKDDGVFLLKARHRVQISQERETKKEVPSTAIPAEV
jgi:hypothetical protein